MKTLDAAKAVEDFAKFLNQVHSRQESFEIIDHGVPCAYLVPVAKRQCTSHQLAQDLADAELTPADRRALAAAIRKGRRVLTTLKNPWG